MLVNLFRGVAGSLCPRVIGSGRKSCSHRSALGAQSGSVSGVMRLNGARAKNANCSVSSTALRSSRCFVLECLGCVIR